MIIIYILAVIGAISLLRVVAMVFLLTICSMDDPDEKETHEKQWICALTNEHCIFTVERGTCNGCPILEEAEKIGNRTVSGIEKGDFYCYEVKSSVEDFHSKNGHNFIGDFNYYIMPEEVYAAVSLEIPYAVGVYCPDGAELRSVKKAKRKDRERPVSEMLLMMFRSAARERRRGD